MLTIVTDLTRSCRSRMVSWWPEVTLALRFPQRRCSWPRRWWLVDVTGRGNPSSVPHRSVQHRIHVLCRSVQKWSHCSVICATNPKLELTSQHEKFGIWFWDQIWQNMFRGEEEIFFLLWTEYMYMYKELNSCWLSVFAVSLIRNYLLLVTNIYRKKWENLKLCKKYFVYYILISIFAVTFCFYLCTDFGVNDIILLGIKYLHKKARTFNNNLLMTFCLLLCTDVGVDGEEAPPHEGRVQWCGQCCARRGRLCHVVRRNCQGRLPTGVSQNDAEGQS